MNYYERHLGDFIKDTVSLTMLEDGAYNRLIDQCYQTEEPLPLDRKEIYRLARANSGPERKAVDYVVSKFFQETSEGYVQKRIQAEIEKFQSKTEDSDERKENERERQKRHRQRRKELFAALREHGEIPHYDTSTEELVTLLSRVTERNRNEPVTRTATANQSPVTSHQSPDLKPRVNTATVDLTEVGPGNSESAGCSAAELSKVMCSFGVRSQPADPRLIALAEQGVSTATVASACAEAKASKPNENIKPGYVFAILTRWAAESAALKVAGAAQPRASPKFESERDKSRRETNEALTGKTQNENRPKIIDIN